MEIDEIGPVEQGVQRDLERYPETMREGGLAAMALMMGRQLDVAGGALPLRDVAAGMQQIRQCLVTLREQEPGGSEGDTTDGARARRERRLHLVPDSGV